MPPYKKLLILLGFSLTAACGQSPSSSQSQSEQSVTPCSAERYAAIDAVIQSGDGMGHGPDIGSGEWKSVVVYKLGLQDNKALPNADAAEWCDFISQQLDK